MPMARRIIPGIVPALTVVLSACGGGSHGSSAAQATTSQGTGSPASRSTPETNPAGDIPDNQVYVPFSPPGGRFTVKVPEGWARSQSGAAAVFADKLNSIRIESHAAAAAPTVASATSQELPKIKAAAHGFVPGKVTAVGRKAGMTVKITYRADAAPDPVTGKTVTDAVERYEYWHAGQQVTLTLSGPVGADNIDPWNLVSDSLRWR